MLIFRVLPPGPDVGQGLRTNLTTGHVDLAPTLLTLAGYGTDMSFDEIGLNLDGQAISFPLENTADFERNRPARGET